MTSLVGEKRNVAEIDQDIITLCKICYAEFDSNYHFPHQCCKCTNFPICEKCYKKGSTIDGIDKPMNCPQCQREGPLFIPDRTILKFVTSIKKSNEYEVNWRKQLCLNNVIPIENCLSLGKNPVPDLHCMSCGTNFADAYCIEDSQAFFLCNECKPNRPIRQVTINSDFVESFLETEQQKLSAEIRSLSSTKISLLDSVQHHRDMVHNLENFQKLIENAISCHRKAQETQMEKLRQLSSLSALEDISSNSHGLSTSKRLNMVYSLLHHTANITSALPPVPGTMEVDAPTSNSDSPGNHDSSSSSSHSSSSVESSLQSELRGIFTSLLDKALLSATRAAEEDGSGDHANHPSSGEAASSMSTSLVEESPAPPPELFTLENSGKPTYMITFDLIAPRRYDLPALQEDQQIVVHDVPAHTPIICYSESTSQSVVLRDMDSDVVLRRYGFQKPMGLAKYLNFLFVVDCKSRCVYTIDLLSDDNPIVFPSMKKEQNIFVSPSGLVVVDQYLIVMDSGPRAKPSPQLHVFDLQHSDYPLVKSIPLHTVMNLKNTNPCCLSVKDEEEKSFYIISDDEVVTCTLERPQSVEGEEVGPTRRAVSLTTFSGFQEEQASRRRAGIPCPYSAAVHCSSAGRKLVYVSNNAKTEWNKKQQYIYVCDASSGEIDNDLSTQLSERLRPYMEISRDSPKHLCLCTIPVSSSSSSEEEDEEEEGGAADHTEGVTYLLVSLKLASNTIICLRID